MTYTRAEREAYLDGYRTGLGAAVRAIDGIRHACGDDGAITAILGGLASGLRLCSASATLAEDCEQ